MMTETDWLLIVIVLLSNKMTCTESRGLFCSCCFRLVYYEMSVCLSVYLSSKLNMNAPHSCSLMMYLLLLFGSLCPKTRIYLSICYSICYFT